MAGIEGYPGMLADMTAGDTREFCIKVTRKTSSGEIVAEDITGHQFYVAISKDRDIETNPAVEMTLVPEDGSTGLVYGNITADQSLSMSGGYFYLIKWMTPAGAKTTVDLGIIKFRKPV